MTAEAVKAGAVRPEAVKPAGFKRVLRGLDMTLFSICAIIVFFLWVPGSPMDWAYALPILVGVGITLLIGEGLLLVSRGKA